MSARIGGPQVALQKQRRLRAGGLLLLVVFPLLPVVRANAFTFGWALTSSIMGLSLNLLVGYAGQISLAHAVLLGTGAFTLGNLATLYGVPWAVALLAAGLVTAAISLIIGFPALRIRGLNLAIATLAFQFLMQRVAFRAKFLTGGAAGIDVARPTILGRHLEQHADYLWVVLAVLAVLWIIDRNLTRSRAGRAFLAIKQDEQVAASFGIPVARYKLLAFALSGFYAGIAGGLFGTLVGDVTNELFDYLLSIELLVFAVLGGLGSRAGTAAGSAFPILYRQFLQRLRYTGVALGGLLLVFTLLRYQGGMAAQGREFAHIVMVLRRRGALWIPAFLGSLLAAIGLATAGYFLLAGVFRFLGNIAAPLDPLAPLLSISGALLVFFVSSRLLAERLVAAAAPAHSRAPEAPTLATPDPAPAPDPDGSRPGLRLRSTRRRAPAGTPLLEVAEVAMAFGGVQALDGVSLRVSEGEIVGVLGPNGSGKTTLFNCISGFLRPHRGRIGFLGDDLLGLPPHRRSALGIARTFQQVGLVKSETVFRNFVIAQHMLCDYGPLEGLMRTRTVLADERRLWTRASGAIDMLGLGAVASEPVAALPHGTAKMVELGCALASGARLLLLDEPAAGVDPQEVDRMGEILKSVQRDFGVTVLLIEHHVPLVLSSCDYVYVLNFGQVLAEGEPERVAGDPNVISAYLGTSSLVEAGDAPA